MAILLCAISAALAHGDLHDRIDQLTSALDSRANDQAALYARRGELRRQHGDFREAVTDLRRALELDSSLSDARVGLAKALLGCGKAPEALFEVDRYFSAQREDPEAYVLRARSLRALGRADEAVLDYKKAIAANAQPSPELYVETADILVGIQRVSDALALIEEGISRLGRAASLERKAIELELKTGNYDSALARVEARLARNDRNPFFHAERGSVLEQAGRTVEARRAYILAKGFLAAGVARESAAAVQLGQAVDEALRRTGGEQKNAKLEKR